MSAPRAVRVLVAEASSPFRDALTGLIAADPGFEVVAIAGRGLEAAALARELRPDVLTVDLDMPAADGFAAIARVMAETPTPILVLTANPVEAVGFRALSLGALDLLAKPGPREGLEAFGAQLRARLRLISGIRVIRHPRGVRDAAPTPAPRAAARRELVVIGASLGGPRALATVLKALPPEFPAPIAVVQHIAEGFTDGLAGWLAQESRLDVATARDGELLRPGRVLLAPSGRHLVVQRPGVARLSDAPPLDTFRPSVTPLFRSAAEAYGPRACGVLLTGMGRDGADGLLALRDAGALTVVQDEATSAVFGMPRAAIELGAAERVLPLGEIAAALLEEVR
ncbi:MAG TPA: chemotaxis-specific protein-glutamate methyltransferase CheB [Anaeromyxobacteraceae bacterium]|nr:chemotaxis-specific protein-glutamate methyltransferase CheB [Anaeromyxobacteraceae bacterium]